MIEAPNPAPSQDDEGSAGLAIVLTTWPAGRDVAMLARPLVEERLAACVNVLPVMRSVYRWEGAVQDEPEHQLVIKTTFTRLEALEARLRALHPYEVPELLVVPVARASASYAAWARRAVAW